MRWRNMKDQPRSIKICQGAIAIVDPRGSVGTHHQDLAGSRRSHPFALHSHCIRMTRSRSPQGSCLATRRAERDGVHHLPDHRFQISEGFLQQSSEFSCCFYPLFVTEIPFELSSGLIFGWFLATRHNKIKKTIFSSSNFVIHKVHTAKFGITHEPSHSVSALRRLAALPLLLTCRGSRKT